MHLYSQRLNVAAQVAEELKTVTYTIPPMEERRKKVIYIIMTSMWPSACSGEQELAVAGSECGAMDPDDRWEMSEVKVEIDVAEQMPISCKTEKDDQGQWWAVAS